MTRHTGALAFTLVELLVVITIIVILLALVTPALDQAVYQAELAACGAVLHAGTAAVHEYALGSRGFYPRRTLHQAAAAPPHQIMGSLSPAVANNNNNERASLGAALGRGLTPLLNCPLSGQIDIDTTQSSGIWIPYNLWFGWQYRIGGGTSAATGAQRFKGMYKVGDRFTWTDVAPGAVEVSFDLLISDLEVSDIGDGGPFGYGSHPDRDGAWTNWVWQDVANPWRVPGGVASSPLAPAGDNITLSWWIGPASRGPVDLNFAHQDGSVRRQTQVAYKDPRLEIVPYYSDQTARPSRQLHIPQR